MCGVAEDTKKGVGWSAVVACYSAAASVACYNAAASVACYSAAASVACYSAAASVAVCRRVAFLVVGIRNFVVGKPSVPIFHANAANG